jgi:hypothetical protein
MEILASQRISTSWMVQKFDLFFFIFSMEEKAKATKCYSEE